MEISTILVESGLVIKQQQLWVQKKQSFPIEQQFPVLTVSIIPKHVPFLTIVSQLNSSILQSIPADDATTTIPFPTSLSTIPSIHSISDDDVIITAITYKLNRQSTTDGCSKINMTSNRDGECRTLESANGERFR
ncbi:MAG: hypothetical protein EZS28_052158 [Streblomastix strix]|uniref:Uncharacterized protein n=1 Tax=Streblomastix strix TaxID=222440 RepID=A0A5J4SGZ4_9EUKA|nr:MAG: hypothetical protein EZS28_052158 [Streblomastix strix]